MASSGAVQAAVLVGWNFDGQNAPAEFEALSVSPLLQAGGGLNTLAPSADLTFSAQANDYQTHGYPATTDTTQWTVDSPHISFSLAPVTDTSIVMNRLYWNHQRRGTETSQVRVGYRIAETGPWTVSGWYQISGSRQSVEWNLGSAIVEDEAEFRLWVLGSDTFDSAYRLTDGTPDSGFNFVLFGSEYIIPEPATLAFILIGALFLWRVRVRHGRCGLPNQTSGYIPDQLKS